MRTKGKQKITVNGAEYSLQIRNACSSCSQCDLAVECWDLYHYNAPCMGGFYKKV